MKQPRKTWLRLPQLLIAIYLCSTFILYFFFDFTQSFSEKVPVLIFISISFVCLFIGMFCRRVSGWEKNTSPIDNFKSIELFIIFVMLISVTSSIYTVFQYYSLADIARFITKPGLAYEYVKSMFKHDMLPDIGVFGSVFGVIMNIASIANSIFPILCIQYWSKLSKKTKYLAIMSLIVLALYSILIGAMINVGILLFSLVPIVIFTIFSDEKDVNHENSSFMVGRRRISINYRKIMILIPIILIIILIYFIGDRNIYGDSNNSKFINGLIGLSDYVAQGYHGLSLSLRLPFEFTAFQTSLRGISKYFIEIFGFIDYWTKSYLYRSQVAFGWDGLTKWSTIFPWLASDITFYTIPVLLLFVGRLYTRTWDYITTHSNIFGFVFLGRLTIAFFMIPTNNYLFHTFSNLTGTFIVFMLYVFERKRIIKIITR